MFQLKSPGAMTLIEYLTETEEPTTLKATYEPIAQAAAKTAYRVDPLHDGRWDELVRRHPRASLFHSTAWLKSLSKTYRYTPVVYTTSAPGQKLENGIVFCEVASWLTGKRLVSLPFSDHCEPLIHSPEDVQAVVFELEQEARRGQLRYIEMRPLRPFKMVTSMRHAGVPYTMHQLDLEPNLSTLFCNCHKNSTQRKILRADREGLEYREGASEELLADFYSLHTNTRKRHHRPPQPRKWFINLMECFGDALKIRVALKDRRPVASVVTIRYKDTMVYKYGGSDPQFNHLGSMHFLLWRSIQEAKGDGLKVFDFGRTEADQHGLITFKKRWGTAQVNITYSRYGLSEKVTHMFESSSDHWKSRVATYVLAHLQPAILSTVGRALYRHVG